MPVGASENATRQLGVLPRQIGPASAAVEISQKKIGERFVATARFELESFPRQVDPFVKTFATLKEVARQL
jgi:hypothetical protein